MNKPRKSIRQILTVLASCVLLIVSCNLSAPDSSAASTPASGAAVDPLINTARPTPLPTRKTFTPGELVDYTAQAGDSLPTLALRFNTSTEEILLANPQIPRDATTMPPGMPMKIPIYYLALWASPFQIIPDHAFVYGPTSIGFNTAAFVEIQPGWLKNYRAYSGGKWRTGAEIVDYVAVNYSINPRLLLAILEYQTGALSQPNAPDKKKLLGLSRKFWETPYLQLVLAANLLNNGYYGWRIGKLLEFENVDSILIRPDPWQNPGSVAIQYYFSNILSGEEFTLATGPDGLFKTYKTLFGDPWSDSFIHIPGSLQQPEFMLPFQYDQVWSFTGGPHTGWGTGEPLAAIDFAPPSEKSGCVSVKPENFVTAMADGLVVRSGVEGVALDLDKDGNEHTGWVIFYLHLAGEQRAPLGTDMKAGDMIGYPSCVGGHATGTHVHIARKYNGEWMLADSVIPLTMNGWAVHNGTREYLGTLTKGSSVVTACDCGDAFTSISGSYP
ncbi:MAG: LysM peptidoglycan-binding domain-containing protein [Anaerolineales bacterium]|nr:LysM peptidoglycan-binding domain-containing protein [Anaerolineales bacterium]